MAVLPTFPNMSKGQTGRWIFVPAQAWETKPDEYYSMAASSIYLRLAFRLPDEDVKFCMKFGIVPRPTISNKQLPVFVEGARAGVGCASAVISTANLVAPILRRV